MPSRLPGWIRAIRELLHEVPGQQNEPSVLINRPGQVLMGLALTLLAVLGYFLAWTTSKHLGHSWKMCLTLETPGLLQQNHTETLKLISSLDSATAGQKLRLNQQATWIVHQMDGLCKVSIWYRSQGTALMTVATGAAALLMVSVALGLPKGLAGSNRILQAMMLSATVQLVLVMSFLQLGEQNLNGTRNLSSYRAHRQLLQWMQSGLANQDLVLDQANVQARVAAVTELNARAQVAELIRAVDNRLQALPAITIGLDDGLATEMYGRVTTDAPPAATAERPTAQPAAAAQPRLQPPPAVPSASE
jgi:hypothetical protein